jgi:DNA polymerase-3 subunit gamma/tau
MTAVAPEREPAPQVAGDPDPESFRDLVALFAEKREIQLRNHLYMNVHLIAYEPGHLEFRPNDTAPKKLSGDVLNCLRQWRGAHWSVSVSREAGEPTLSEQDTTHEQAELTAAAQDPVVRAALDTFTGARIERVTSRDGASEDGGIEAPFEAPGDDDFDGEDSDQ